jgi:hypothetical protein
MVDLALPLTPLLRIVCEIREDIVIRQRKIHILVVSLLFLHKGRIVGTREQATEIAETDILLSLRLLLSLAVVNRKRSNQFPALLLGDLLKKQLLIELPQLRSRHDRLFVVPNDRNEGGLVVSVLDLVLAAKVLEYFGQIFLNGVKPQQILKSKLVEFLIGHILRFLQLLIIIQYLIDFGNVLKNFLGGLIDLHFLQNMLNFLNIQQIASIPISLQKSHHRFSLKRIELVQPVIV